MRRMISCLLLSLGWLSCRDVLAAESWGQVRAYMCRKADKPPTLDGVLDDPCWEDSHVAGDFVPTGADKGNAAEPRTAVRFCYDHRALYL